MPIRFAPNQVRTLDELDARLETSIRQELRSRITRLHAVIATETPQEALARAHAACVAESEARLADLRARQQAKLERATGEEARVDRALEAGRDKRRTEAARHRKRVLIEQKTAELLDLRIQVQENMRALAR